MRFLTVKHIWTCLFALSCAAAALFGLNLLPTLTVEARVGLVRYYAIYPLALALAGLSWAVVAKTRASWRFWWRRDRTTYLLWLACTLMVAAAGAFLTTREPFGWLVVDDEIVSAAAATHMTKTGESFRPWTVDYGSSGAPAYRASTGFVDKRPATQAFLASVRNWVFGYDPYSTIWVNVGLTWLTCALLAALVFPFGGLWGVGVTLLLYCAVPLTSHLATSGDLSPPSVCFLLVCALWSRCWLTARTSLHLTGLVCAGILLCYTRYEAALAVIPLAVVLFVGWQRSKTILINGWLVLLPLCLVFIPLRNDTFTLLPALRQLGRLGRQQAFSTNYVASNLASWVDFFFHPSLGNPANPWIVFALVATVAYVGLRPLSWRLHGRTDLATGVWLLTSFAFAAPLAFYYWGELNDPFVWRLSLPIWLGLCWATGVYLVPTLRHDPLRIGFLALAVVAGGFGLHSIRADIYSLRYTTVGQARWFDTQLRTLMTQPNARKIVIVTHEQCRVNAFLLRGMGYTEAMSEPGELKALIDSGHEVWWYNEFYVIRGVEYLMHYMEIPREFVGGTAFSAPTASNVVSKLTRLVAFDPRQPARKMIRAEVRGAELEAALAGQSFNPAGFIK